MIIEERRNSKYGLTRREKGALLLIIVLSGFLIPYVGFFLYSMEDYNSYAYNLSPPDSSTFIDADPDILGSMAMWYEQNIVDYHLPNGQLVNTRFKDSGRPSSPEDVVSYHVTYDSCEWTGHYLMAEAYRHAVHLKEDNPALAEQTLNIIKSVLKGIDMRLHVSGNGGMARYYWPIDEYPNDPNNIQDDNHYKVSYEGEEYILEDDTSRDMHNGIIMGLGCAYLMVEDPETREHVKELVEFMLDYFLDNGWLYHKPTDDPNGTDLDAGFWLFGTSGIWTLAYLKVGVLVNPEKYGDLYREMAYERDYAHRSAIPFMSRTNLVQAYYGLLLDFEVLYILVILEEDPNLKGIFLDYIGQIYDYTKYDRTAQFSAMWLIMNDVNLKNANDDQKVIIRDFSDCLMRYHGAPQRLPGRNINITNEDVSSEKSRAWLDFYEEGIGNTFYPFYRSIYQFQEVADQPLTPDQRPQTDYLWSRDPYQFQSLNQDGRSEGPAADYTAIYWPCRYYGLIEEPTTYTAELNIKYPAEL